MTEGRPPDGRARMLRAVADHRCTTDAPQSGGSASSVPHPVGWGNVNKLQDGSSPSSSALSEEQQLHVEVIDYGSAVWVRLRGEADLANHEQLRSALGGVQLDRVRTVHLVLADLTFCDLYAFRHLVAFAERVHASGCVLYAHEPQPVLRKLATLLDVAPELHFV